MVKSSKSFIFASKYAILAEKFIWEKFKVLVRAPYWRSAGAGYE
jgi:hypothetical protein